VKVCLFVLAECTNVSDRQMVSHTHTYRHRHIILAFHTKRHSNIPTGTPVMGCRMQVGQVKISILNKYLALQSVIVALYFSISHLAAGFFVDSGYPRIKRNVLQAVTVGSTLRRRQQNRIELYALVNPKPK